MAEGIDPQMHRSKNPSNDDRFRVGARDDQPVRFLAVEHARVFGARIRHRRQELDLHLNEVATVAGMRPTALATIEGGLGEVTTRALAWIALSLRVPDAHLLGGLRYEIGCADAGGLRPCLEETAGSRVAGSSSVE